MAAKLGFEAIEYVLKKALTKKGVKGIPTIPGPAYKMQIRQLTDAMADKMRKMGYDINKVTEKQVQGLLDYAEAMEKQKLKNIQSKFYDPSGKMKPAGEDIMKKGLEGLGKKKDPLLKDSPEAIAKIKAENKAAAERIRQRRYEEAVKAEQDKMAADEDYIPDIIDPEDFASGGIAGELHLNRPGYQFGGKALKAIMEAWRANKTWGVGGPPFRPEKTSFNIREMTKRNLGQEFSLKELKEISESPFGEFASRGTGRAPTTFKEFNTEFKNIKARILKEKLEESKLHAEAMISSAKQIPAEDATAKKIHAQFIREGKKQLEEANEGLKAIDIYMGMLQKKGRSVHAEGGLAHVLGV